MVTDCAVCSIHFYRMVLRHRQLYLLTLITLVESEPNLLPVLKCTEATF